MNMKKTILVAITLLCSCLLSFAQEVKVISYQERPQDEKARTSSRVLDSNGQLTALVEVVTPSVTGLTFDTKATFGEINYYKGTYSVHVPEGTKTITFYHPKYKSGVIDLASNGITPKSGETYRAILQFSDLNNDLVQYLVLNVRPRDAKVEVDGQEVDVDYGIAKSIVKVGTSHHYKVSADGMITAEDDVVVTTPEEELTVFVSLVGNIAQVRVNAVDNAEILVNGRVMGTGVWRGALTAGTYEFESRLNGKTTARETRNIVSTGDVQEINLRSIQPVSNEQYTWSAPVQQTATEQQTTATKTQTATEKPVAEKPVVEKPQPTKTVAQKPQTTEPTFFITPIIGIAPGRNDISAGLMAGYCKNFGGYVKARSNFRFIESDFEYRASNREGLWLEGDPISSIFAISAGAMAKLGSFYPYAGAGYGYRRICSKLSSVYPEPTYALASAYSISAPALDLGVAVKLGQLTLSAGTFITNFKYTDIELGIGINF